MDYKYKLFWSNKALENLDNIYEYLEYSWTQKEVDKFTQKLSLQLDVILRFPQAFPKSEAKPRLRKAVLSKQTTILYEIKDSIIYIIYLLDNRQDPNKK